MNYFFVFLITTYQRFFSPAIKYIFGVSQTCRFSPTCSEYAKESLIRHGTVKGVFVSTNRLLRCHPFFNQ